MGQDKAERQGDELENISVVQTRSEGTKASSVGEEGIRHMGNIPGGIDRIWFTDMRRVRERRELRLTWSFPTTPSRGFWYQNFICPVSVVFLISQSLLQMTFGLQENKGTEFGQKETEAFHQRIYLPDFRVIMRLQGHESACYTVQI